VPMSPGYIPFHPNPSKPSYKPPAGAVDAHCHVFGPEAAFPFAPKRKYTPCDAPKEKLFALRDFLGFDKNVIVQASCHSKDNRAMIDALESSNNKARGVAFVGEEVTDDELKWMDKAGVRGVRFNFLKRLVDFTPRDVLQRIAARVDKLGWHIVVYFEMPDLPELESFFTALPTTVVVDHMGTPTVKKGVNDPENLRFHDLMDKHKNFWVKATCPERMTIAGPLFQGGLADDRRWRRCFAAATYCARTLRRCRFARWKNRSRPCASSSRAKSIAATIPTPRTATCSTRSKAWPWIRTSLSAISKARWIISRENFSAPRQKRACVPAIFPSPSLPPRWTRPATSAAAPAVASASNPAGSNCSARVW